MDLSDNDVDDIQEDQITFWLKQPNAPVALYREPKLENSTVEVIKVVCDVLQQTDEVFITSVDVVEEYVGVKDLQNIERHNSLLIIVCAVLTTSKLIGSHPEIKITAIQTIITKLTKENIQKEMIKETELNIFLTLGRIPLSTMATDLSMFLKYYVKNLKLRVNIQPLCLEILNVVYISRKQLFFQLKAIYTQTVDALQVFQHLVCNKMYFPCGVVLCALRITKFNNFLDLNQVAQDIEKIAAIHYDHLQLLAGTIYETIKET